MSKFDYWGTLAEKRLKDRLLGNDYSYNNILLPTIIGYLSNFSKECKILDFGCGTGELTLEISKLGLQTIGIDISSNSINLATEYFKSDNLKYYNESLENCNYKESFNIVVANMVLMNIKDLPNPLMLINQALMPGGKFVIIITHPSFWPIYWDYFNDENFSYFKESTIIKTYKTKNTTFDGNKIIHYHRPIEFYVKVFLENNFNLISLKELKDDNSKEWYSRFLYFELEKKFSSFSI